MRPYKLLEGGKEITIYISEEEKKLRSLARNEREMVRYFVRHLAQTQLKKRLSKLLEEINTKSENKLSEPPIANSVKWTGKNRNEFIQLIYAMYESNLINNG